MAEGKIAEAETKKGILEWNRMKDYMEENPVRREVITSYIGGGGMPSAQHGIAYVPKTEPYLLHRGEAVLPAASAGTTGLPIEVKVETTIYNYSDVENLERMIAEATSRGIHDAYGGR